MSCSVLQFWPSRMGLLVPCAWQRQRCSSAVLCAVVSVVVDAAVPCAVLLSRSSGTDTCARAIGRSTLHMLMSPRVLLLDHAWARRGRGDAKDGRRRFGDIDDAAAVSRMSLWFKQCSGLNVAKFGSSITGTMGGGIQREVVADHQRFVHGPGGGGATSKMGKGVCNWRRCSSGISCRDLCCSFGRRGWG